MNRQDDRDDEEPLGLRPSEIRHLRSADYLVRFAFGAVVAAAAAIVGVTFGPRVGGIFLAFPAILPATLTLIEKREGKDQAEADASGGILGGVGLAAFAIVASLSLGRISPAIALMLALLAWTVVSVGLYFAIGRRLPHRFGHS